MKSQRRKYLFMAMAIAMLIFNSINLLAQEKDGLFTKDSLTVMSEHLNNTEGKAFKLFLKYPEKVNAVLGKDKAQYLLRKSIYEVYFKGVDPNKKPDFEWSKLKNTMKSKFGEIGLETLYSKQMMYYLEAKDWGNFGKYYVLYFEKALKRPEYDINNLNWVLFENVSDPKVLKFACDVVMKYAMEEWYQNDFQTMDTYANLLYKTGQKEKAIEWEAKAVKLSNNNKEIVETLEKMQRNEKTWVEKTVNP